jgi:SAM-dependent methyltransferase
VEAVDRALASLNDVTERARSEMLPPAPTGAPPLPTPTEADPDERDRLAARVEELAPWAQGPFSLPGGLVAGEDGRDQRRWIELGREIPDDLSGLRVVDVGCGAGYDSFELARRGADQVLGCEWTPAIEQARFLEGVYGTGASFAAIGWEDLDPDRHGTFDLVHCDGVLQRVAAPMRLLGRLWRITAPGGTLLLGSMLLDPPELSRYAGFAACPEAGWVPGRLALRWMAECSGFDGDGWFGERPGQESEPRISTAYLRAIRSERPPAAG